MSWRWWAPGNPDLYREVQCRRVRSRVQTSYPIPYRIEGYTLMVTMSGMGILDNWHHSQREWGGDTFTQLNATWISIFLWWPWVHIEIGVLWVLWDREHTIRMIWGYLWLVERHRIGLIVVVQLWDVCYRFPSYFMMTVYSYPRFLSMCFSHICFDRYFWGWSCWWGWPLWRTCWRWIRGSQCLIPGVVWRLVPFSYGQRVCWSRRVLASLSFGLLYLHYASLFSYSDLCVECWSHGVGLLCGEDCCFI